MCRRTTPGSRVTSTPATVAVPDVGRTSVVSIRIVVVLPAPFGPSTATSSPGAMSRSIPRTACTVWVLLTSKSLVSPRVWIIGLFLSEGVRLDSLGRSGQILSATSWHPGPMSTPSSRLLSLLSLLQTRRDWPGDVLADRLGVSPRTVRRDVDRLRELGYPVHAAKGPDGGYRLEPGTHMPPLLLDDEQAVALVVALQTASTGVDGVDEAAVRALATLRQVMPARLRSAVEALQVTAVTRAPARNRPSVDADTLLVVGSAVRAREVL